MARINEKSRLFLRFINTCDSLQRRAILRHIHVKQLKLLVEIIYNVLHGVIAITKQYKKYLMTKKKVIRRITSPGLSIEERKKAILKLEKDIPRLIQIYFNYESRNGIDL